MKRMAVASALVVMILAIGIGSASAENSLKQGSLGMGVTVDDEFFLSGRYFVMNDLAVLAKFGVGAKGGDAEGTDIAVGAGVRKYLKTADFAPFVGGELFYERTDDGAYKEWDVFAELGAEYFLHKQFSVEGTVAFGYQSIETETGPGTTFKETTFATHRFGIGFNLYFF